MSKEDFKSFVARKPQLAKYVNDGSMSWQKFYEMYNLYGENNDVWKTYENEDRFSAGNISSIIKNVDVDSIKEHINTAQKALDFVQELTSKGTVSSKKITTPRPLNKFFED